MLFIRNPILKKVERKRRSAYKFRHLELSLFYFDKTAADYSYSKKKSIISLIKRIL